MKQYTIALFFIIAVSGVSAAYCQERKIERKDLPKEVEATVARESAGATIKGFATEKEGGVWTYEAELVVDGLTRDIAIDSKGNILEVEQEVVFNSLSDNVRSGLTKAAGTGTIGKVESLTKRGSIVAYEAVVTNGKKRSEIQVGPNGKALAKEE
jgi:uncharacterized membrane protein YkoI